MSAKDQAQENYAVGYGKPPEASRFQKGHKGFPRRRTPEAKSFAETILEKLDEMQTISKNGKREKRSSLDLGISNAARAFANGDPRPMERMLKLAPRLEEARPPRKTRKSLAQIKREYLDEINEELYLIVHEKAGVEPGKNLSPEDIQRARDNLRVELIAQGVPSSKFDPAPPSKADGVDAGRSAAKSNYTT